jgi:hypothetical protein
MERKDRVSFATGTELATLIDDGELYDWTDEENE